MGLGLQGAYGAMGAQDELKQLLAKRIADKQYADHLAQQHADNQMRERQIGQGDRRIGLDERSLGEYTRQFDARLGMDEKTLGERTREFDEQAPSLEAGRLYTVAQTGELGRKPQVEEAARDFGREQAKTEHGYRLGEIGAQGAQARETAQAKTGAGNVGGPYADERANRTLQSVNELSNKVNRWTTGVGSVLSGVPESDARNFSAELNTLKANIAFNELAQMRNASKTGGALGAVSERELALLESALGALDQGQSPDQIKGQLQKIGASIQRWQAAQGGNATPMASHGQAAAQEFDYVPGKGLVPRGAK